MKHTTHSLTIEQKESLFNTHRDLIYMAHCFGGFMLRRQMKNLFCLLSKRDEKDVEFDISELIFTGFLLQKSISRDTNTQMLYLSKYPKSRLMNIESRDVAAINWTNQKIMEQIFKIDYIIEKLLLDMSTKKYLLETDNILSYLQYNGSNLLLSNNQTDILTFYQILWNRLVEQDFTLTDDFFRDVEIASHELKCFQARQLKQVDFPPPYKAKIQRDMERASYNSETERNKYFYTLKNFASNGFYLESIWHNHINIYFFDSRNNIQTRKLHEQLCYILMMFQRYLNNYNIQLFVTVYTWDKERAEHLKSEQEKRAYDFYRQEWTEENKQYKTYQDIGLLRQYWDSIHVSYASENLYSKYNIHP